MKMKLCSHDRLVNIKITTENTVQKINAVVSLNQMLVLILLHLISSEKSRHYKQNPHYSGIHSRLAEVNANKKRSNEIK